MIEGGHKSGLKSINKIGRKGTKIYHKCAHGIMIEGGHKSVLKSINKIGWKGT